MSTRCGVDGYAEHLAGSKWLLRGAEGVVRNRPSRAADRVLRWCGCCAAALSRTSLPVENTCVLEDRLTLLVRRSDQETMRNRTLGKPYRVGRSDTALGLFATEAI